MYYWIIPLSEQTGIACMPHSVSSQLECILQCIISYSLYYWIMHFSDQNSNRAGMQQFSSMWFYSILPALLLSAIIIYVPCIIPAD